MKKKNKFPRLYLKALRRTDPDCKFCEENKNEQMMPWHDASYSCESGKHLHCTCSICID